MTHPALFAVLLLFLGMALGALFLSLFWGHVVPTVKTGSTLRIRGVKDDYVVVNSGVYDYGSVWEMRLVRRAEYERDRKIR